MLWLAGVLGLGAMTIFNVYIVVEDYLHYPIVSYSYERSLFNVSFDDSWQRGLPEMTVCNRDPLQSESDKFPDLVHVEDYIETVEQAYEEFKANSSVEESGDKELKEIIYNMKAYQGYFQYIGKEKASMLGHQQERFIAHCSLLFETTASERRTTDCTKITQFVSPEFFNCYTISFNRESNDVDGIPIGMSLLLFLDHQPKVIDPFDRTDDVLQGRGARISYHDPNALPNLWYQAVDGAPGQFTHILHKMRVRKRKKEPYGNCIDEKAGKDYWDLRGHVLRYTDLACMNACAQELIIKECHCLDPTLLLVTSRDQLTNMSYCGKYQDDIDAVIERMRCVYKKKNTAAIQCRPKCTPVCAEREYETTTTSVAWPQKSQLIWFYRMHLQSGNFPIEI